MITIVIGLGLLILLLLLGVPIAFSFFGAVLALCLYLGYDVASLVPYAYTKVNSLTLLAIPLFVLAGVLMEKGGIGKALVDFVSIFVAKINGGLGVAVPFSCAAFGAVSGSGYATISCIGSILMPRMREKGYPPGHSAALLSSSGVLGLMIPPSLNMIMIAFLTQASMLSCFMAGFLPGVILTCLLAFVNCVLLRKNDTIEKDTEYLALPRREKLSFIRGKTMGAIPAIICPLIILGGIYAGLFTPTEAAAVAALYAVPVGLFIYKGLSIKRIGQALLEAGTTTGTIFMMLFSVMMLSRIFISENVPQMILEFLSSISDSRFVILLMINLFIIIVGMLMDDGSAILLVTPILLPIMGQLGIGTVHFAVIVAVNVGLGTVTPPCAPFLYFAARVGEASVSDMLKPTFAFILGAWLPVLLLVTYFPTISTIIPSLLGLPV